MAQGVQGAVGEMIDGHRAAQVFLLPFLLGDEGGVGRGESKRFEGMFPQLVFLYFGKFGDAAVCQIDDGQAVLGRVIGLLFLDLGLAGFLKLRFDEADHKAAVVQDAGLVAPGNHDFTSFFSECADGKISIPFLGIHFVGDDISGRGQAHGSDTLPAVIYAVVQRFLLCLQADGRRNEKCA